MIVKEISIPLTEEEINSSEDVEIHLTVFSVSEPEDSVTYTITYPKQ